MEVREDQQIQEIRPDLKKVGKVYLLARVLYEILRESIIYYTARSLGWQGTFFDPDERASQDIWTKTL